MRAGASLTIRDIYAARASWQRARGVADRLPAEHAARETMRIAPRTLLCASTFRAALAVDDSGYDELCALVAAADDKVSFAIGTAGQVAALGFAGRYREAAGLAGELAKVVEEIADPVVTVMQLPHASMVKILNGEVAEGLRLAQRVIDLCDGDRYLGKSIVESPLTIALMLRAAADMLLGAGDWKSEIEQVTAEAREYTPVGEAIMTTWRYAVAIAAGAFRADAAAVRATAEILRLGEMWADEVNLFTARVMHGLVLAHHSDATRDSGLQMLEEARRAVAEHRTLTGFLVISDVELARERARSGDKDAGIEELAAVFDREMTSGGMALMHARVGEFLVEALLGRGTPVDFAAADAVVETIGAIPVEEGFVWYELPLLRMRAMLARAGGDEAGYCRYRDQYRTRAHELGFEGHIDTAAAMP
jgi:adenylate cyclase